jgi:hypothetical protein
MTTDRMLEEARGALRADLTVRQSPGDSLHPMSARAVQRLRDALEELTAAHEPSARHQLTREAVLTAIDSAAAPAKSCVHDGCRHYARYLDSGDNDLCACHWSELIADECEGQPEPVAPYRERLADAILALLGESAAHTPTGDEREALANLIPLGFREHDGVRNVFDAADRILAAGFRRSVVPEPSGGDDRAEITDEGLWDFAGDLLDAWNIEDLNSPSLAEDFRDRFVARFHPAYRAEPQGEPSDAQSLDWARAYAGRYWQFGGEPETQRALTILAAAVTEPTDNVVPEPSAEHCYWCKQPARPWCCSMAGRRRAIDIFMRPGGEPQGEPSDARVRAALDILGYNKRNREGIRAALRAAAAVTAEPLIECPHWSPGKITLRRGCTACAAVTEQGENRRGYER